MTDTPHDGDVSFIKALAELLRENDLTELRVKREYGEDDSLDVRVSRGQVMAVPAPPPPSLPGPAQTSGAAPAAPSSEPEADLSSDLGAVTSPMVGTAYLAPEPGASNFVVPGDAVQEGQTLLIIEAMKTMNHIPAPRAGIVRRIIVEDGAPVEFGAPLMILE
ncbi:acetyl-CoA carboxylase biotin carboxyl carrier protein [Palleronia sp. LCG004]|uniref:acetyl-CoA carboxylase biotin carboxyl carrier protein n=1 Tax=Palleronia sp. LCG004 TaxID=3079304 RepID=UPI002942F7BF|nr:acetyl-CoA carboxylase biotin carboxyl carrier protein [Palleronia sp. LCG004]WOI55277.1 acetyl-CoA carboxylase biotin carboxyl carrier protein [Palleronia sp. LCG004]